MQTWAITDPGVVREQNQDAYAVVPLGEDDVLCVVCDGMGGARAGNVASKLAADAFSREILRAYRPAMTAEACEMALRDALEIANRAVYEQSRSGEEYHGMGTTLVAAFVKNDVVIVLNVGDSRAYFFSREGMRCLTTDHSLVELMVQRGELTREQAKSHPGKNLITRAVGTEETVICDIYTQEIIPENCLLLCTDGLSNLLADQEILFEVAHGVNRADCCQRLLQIAKARGASDNVTIVLIVR